MEPESKSRRRRIWRRVILGFTAFVVVGFGLFVLNGAFLANGEQPTGGQVDGKASPRKKGNEIKVFAWNIAKCFMHNGGLSFVSTADVKSRLAEMARLIRGEDPDLVFLSEVVTECTLCNVDQVQYLARETGMTHWAFGENFNYGMPFLRIVGGNAILSKAPLQPVANPDLAGRRSFFFTRNNRRMLWCTASLGEVEVLLGAVHTDSFDLENNHRQTRQILAYSERRETLLAGDFNAEPQGDSLAAVLRSGRFSGAIDGPGTFPSDHPDRRIDYVFAPKDWTLIDHRVIPVETSDHRPVVSVFRIQ
jgi:endonuclease/exonuclease/phosphatase family metal-dependent hydrolase